MFGRQLAATISTFACDISICTSFSASVTVCGEISGPTSGPVPNAVGAPGVVCCCSGTGVDGCCDEGAWPYARDTAAPINPADVTVKNCLRDFPIPASGTAL
jgi:hypothetical protein